MRRFVRIFVLCFNIFGVIVVTAHASSAAVKSASPDGEATIYLEGKFANEFDVAYRAIL